MEHKSIAILLSNTLYKRYIELNQSLFKFKDAIEVVLAPFLYDEFLCVSTDKASDNIK